jgi:prepilin-type processing-associated H-X9-DG protein
LLIGERPPSPDGNVGVISAGVGEWDIGAPTIDNDLPYTYSDGSGPASFPPKNTNTGTQCVAPSIFAPAYAGNYCNAIQLGSFHTGGANFAFGDGSVRFISYSAGNSTAGVSGFQPLPGFSSASSVIEALSTKAGGEVVDGSAY